MFVIHEINKKYTPYMHYKKEITRGQKIVGRFYAFELQKIGVNPLATQQEADGVWEIEKILKKFKKKYLVKWKNYDGKRNLNQ